VKVKWLHSFFCTVLVSVFSSCASSPSSSPSVHSNQESKLDTPDKNELENTVFLDGSKVEPKKNSDADRKKDTELHSNSILPKVKPSKAVIRDANKTNDPDKQIAIQELIGSPVHSGGNTSDVEQYESLPPHGSSSLKTDGLEISGADKNKKSLNSFFNSTSQPGEDSAKLSIPKEEGEKLEAIEEFGLVPTAENELSVKNDFPYTGKSESDMKELNRTSLPLTPSNKKESQQPDQTEVDTVGNFLLETHNAISFRKSPREKADIDELKSKFGVGFRNQGKTLYTEDDIRFSKVGFRDEVHDAIETSQAEPVTKPLPNLSDVSEYGKLRSFLNRPGKIAKGAKTESKNNYPHSKDFLETDSKKPIGEIIQNTDKGKDNRYLKSLEWIESRGRININ
jgi:hypothetical protein